MYLFVIIIIIFPNKVWFVSTDDRQMIIYKYTHVGIDNQCDQMMREIEIRAVIRSHSSSFGKYTYISVYIFMETNFKAV